jgi:hypothetical protein
MDRRVKTWFLVVAMVVIAHAVAASGRNARGDEVRLKSGVVLRGVTDKDNTILSLNDGLRKIVIRDSKIESVVKTGLEKYEVFRVDQPLIVHGGVMPSYVVGMKSGDWNESGRRLIEYVGSRGSKPVRMTQAIYELGPRIARTRGVDGFWQGLYPTSEVPRPIVLGILGKIEATNQTERLKRGRFLIQARWYDEALSDLDGIERDFPALAPTVASVRATVKELRARRLFAEIETRTRAGQPRGVAARLASFPMDEAAAQVADDVRALRRAEADATALDRKDADDIARALESMPESSRAGSRAAVLSLLRELEEAPDAVRDRLQAFRDSPAAVSAEVRVARAVSGWLVGAEFATSEPAATSALWDARNALLDYLKGRTEEDRTIALGRLQATSATIDLEGLTRLVRRLPPPLREATEEEAGRVRRLRVRDDPNPEPTDYEILLPPEYSAIRRYPAVVVLHGSESAEAALGPWSEEAARRGFILIAPEYTVSGQTRDYRYTRAEQAAVELALRDARKRFSIDSNRVYVAGTVIGGNMAWDIGLSHPDLFAGVAVISGLPAKYIPVYDDNAKLVPLAVSQGELSPATEELIQPEVMGLMNRNYDVIFIEHLKRGLEPFPEDIPDLFDWMEPRRREPYPTDFNAVSAREGDDRFYGLVIREFAPRRALPPEQVDPFGKNLQPAKMEVSYRASANLVVVTTSGLTRFDLWIPPGKLDLGKRMEIRINGRSAFKGEAKPTLEDFLEDLRIRGDREQVYWLKYQADLRARR